MRRAAWSKSAASCRALLGDAMWTSAILGIVVVIIVALAILIRDDETQTKEEDFGGDGSDDRWK